MAKFTASVPLKIHLPGGFEIDGAVGATHRIPDALYDEFVRDQVPLIPGGVTWVSQDETSAISGFDPSTKYDKTGGTISGAVTVTGTLIAQGLTSVKGLNGVIYADQFSTLAAAIAAAAASATIVVPTGSYSVPTTLTLGSHQRLVGFGPGSKLIFSGTDTASTKALALGNYSVVDGLAIIDQRAYSANPIASVGINATSTLGATVSNVVLSGFAGGGLTAVEATALMVRGCRIDTIGTSVSAVVGDGILLYSCTKSVVTDNVVHHAGKHGINVSGTTAISSDDTVIADNLCYLNGDTGVWLQYAKRASIRGNVCLDNGRNSSASGGQGINVSDNSIDVSIVGNQVSAATEQGIVVQNSCSAIAISANVVRAATWYGIVVKSSCVDVAVTNNVVTDNVLDGILAQDSSNVTITGNVSARNRNNGIRVNTAAVSGKGFVISGNIVRDNNASNSTHSGILLDGALYPSDVAITGNVVLSTATAVHFRGIRLFTGDNVAVTGNTIRGATTNIGTPETSSTNYTIYANEETASLAITQAAATIDTALTTAFVSLSGSSVAWTAVQPETVELLALFDFNNSVAGNDTCTGQIVVNGATQGPTANFATTTAATGRGTVAVAFQMTLAAGSHAAFLQAKKLTNAGTASAMGTNTRIMIRRQPQYL